MNNSTVEEKILIGSQYDSRTYLLPISKEDEFRKYLLEEDKRLENQPIKADLYGDDARFGGVLSGKERPRNQAEYEAFLKGEDYIDLRERLKEEGRERWLKFVEQLGLKEWEGGK